MRPVLWLCTSLVAVAPAAAQAPRFEIKNGLWETTFTHEMQGLPAVFEDQMKSMSPEKRAKLLESMKARQGQRTVTDKTCVTEKDREKMFSPDRDKDKTCKTTVVSQTSRRIEHKMVCTGAMSTVGTMVVEATSSESARGSFDTKSTTPDKPFSAKGTFTSRWLSADCGKYRNE